MQGQRDAEQSAMSLDSLFVAYKQNAKDANETELRESINGLFQQLDNPSAYNAPQFAAQMQKVSSVLARAGRDEKSGQGAWVSPPTSSRVRNTNAWPTPTGGLLPLGGSGGHTSANDPGGACGKTTVRTAVRGNS